MKLVVPLMMPITRLTGSPRRLSRSARITGMPPATAASNKRSTPAESAAAKSSVPTLARSSLLAVTTGLPDCSAWVMSSRAGSMPPITSTTRSTPGSATTAWASRVRRPSGRTTSRSRDMLRTATFTTSSRTPVRASILPACCSISRTSAAPTLPQPNTPMRTTRPRLSTVVTSVRLWERPAKPPRLCVSRRRGERDRRRSPGGPPRGTHPSTRTPRPAAASCCSCWPSRSRRHR